MPQGRCRERERERERPVLTGKERAARLWQGARRPLRPGATLAGGEQGNGDLGPTTRRRWNYPFGPSPARSEDQAGMDAGRRALQPFLKGTRSRTGSAVSVDHFKMPLSLGSHFCSWIKQLVCLWNLRSCEDYKCLFFSHSLLTSAQSLTENIVFPKSSGGEWCVF